MKYKITTLFLFLSLFTGFVTLDIFQANALTPTRMWDIDELMWVILFCVFIALTFLFYKNEEI